MRNILPKVLVLGFIEVAISFAPASDEVRICSVAGSRTGRYVACEIYRHASDSTTSGASELCYFDMVEKRMTSTRIKGSCALNSLGWSNDDRLLAYVSEGLSVSLYRRDDGKQDGFEPGWSSKVPKFAPRGEKLGYVRRGELVYYDIVSRRFTTLTEDVIGNDWDWAPSGHAVLYGFGNGVRTVDLATKTSITIYEELPMIKDRAITNCIFSPDGRRVGFYRESDSSFCSIKHDGTDFQKHVRAEHYHRAFIWLAAGIVYLDHMENEYRDKARLLFYNPRDASTRELLVGSIALISANGMNNIVFRRDATELWELEVSSSRASRVWSIDRDQ